MSKKAFDLARNSIYVAKPEELCIIGGGRYLPDNEVSALDTVHKEGEHELWDPRLRNMMTPESIANIDAFGVQTPIIIVKLDDVPTVVDGRGRVRRARLANLLRKARGEPPISIECKVARPRLGGLTGLMIACNEVRDDDGIPAKIIKLRLLLSRGVSEHDAAVIFGASLGTVRGWLRYADNATPELRAAVEAGAVSPSAAITVSRRDPEAQRAALATGAKSAREVRRAVSNRPSKHEIAGVVEAALSRSDGDPYWMGISQALTWALSGDAGVGKMKKLVERLQEKAP